MTGDVYDPQTPGTRHLTPKQWTERRRSVIRRATDARRETIRWILVSASQTMLRVWRAARSRHEARAELRSMSDYELRDIGLVRSEIETTIYGDRTERASALAGANQISGAELMKAYWIVRVSIRDKKHYPDYLAAARPAFEKFGATFLVRGGAFETMEGSARDRNVVVEFSDRATALACYRSPEYVAAKALRQQYAEADFIIADGA